MGFPIPLSQLVVDNQWFYIYWEFHYLLKQHMNKMREIIRQDYLLFQHVAGSGPQALNTQIFFHITYDNNSINPFICNSKIYIM